MRKIDPTVKKETVYVAAFSLIFSLLMEAVFVLLKQWNLTVLWGNLLGYAAAVANFFLMALTVQLAVAKEDPKQAKNIVKLSQSLRFVLLLLVALIGYLVNCFHVIAVVIPFLFPRFAVTLRGLTMKKQ